MNDPLGKAGILYIVATPIGNRDDISQRALQTLSNVDLILAEDTRHSRHLLNYFAINTKLISCHEYNEEQRIESTVRELAAGKNLALISDAGTPLISDPGFKLVREVRRQGFIVSPVPGASSIIAALSVSGLPTNSFIYDGFLPAKQAARKKQLAHYLDEPRTVVVLESSHRIQACFTDIADVLGLDKRIVIARELTKKFETVLDATAAQLIAQLEQDSNQLRGEFVLLIQGAPAKQSEHTEIVPILTTLLNELPLKQAVSLAAKLTSQRKNDVYQVALSLKQKND